MSIVPRSSIVGDFDTLEVGTKCQVKQRSELFSGEVTTYGKIFYANM